MKTIYIKTTRLVKSFDATRTFTTIYKMDDPTADDFDAIFGIKTTDEKDLVATYNKTKKGASAAISNETEFKNMKGRPVVLGIDATNIQIKTTIKSK